MLFRSCAQKYFKGPRRPWTRVRSDLAIAARGTLRYAGLWLRPTASRYVPVLPGHNAAPEYNRKIRPRHSELGKIGYTIGQHGDVPDPIRAIDGRRNATLAPGSPNYSTGDRGCRRRNAGWFWKPSGFTSIRAAKTSWPAYSPLF